MGELVLAAKVTHVPSMYLSEKPGPLHGCRDNAIEGLRELGRRAHDRGADTLLILDTHWLVQSGYHVNGCDRLQGMYACNEFPHFISKLPYDYEGNPELADLIAESATARGVRTLSHPIPDLDVEYGTLIPLRYMCDEGRSFRVVTMAAWCAWHSIEESRVVGEAIREAIERSGSKVGLLASGSLSHRIHDNAVVEGKLFEISDVFFREMDERVVELWQQGRFVEFTAMLPEYARSCYGEGGMHDTAMLLGALGWDAYDGHAEVLTDYFPSSGTGQINVEFPIPQPSVA